jgi:hypothetical protein
MHKVNSPPEIPGNSMIGCAAAAKFGGEKKILLPGPNLNTIAMCYWILRSWVCKDVVVAIRNLAGS